MNISHKEVADLVGMNEQEFINWTQQFKSTFIEYVDHNGNTGVVYTDGDDGFMLFENECDIFESEGTRVTIGGRYCDIDYSAMTKIISILLKQEAVQ